MLAVSKSEAGIAAVNCVALTSVVVRAVPFHRATDWLLKLVPVKVRLKPAAPTFADVCDIDVSIGAGLLIAKLCPVDVPPPGVGLNTVTEAVPAEAMSAAGTEAVSEVALPNVVVRAVPFHFTTEVLTKLVPVSVSVNVAPPASPEAGAIEVKVGEGLLIVKVGVVSEFPPPGPGLFAPTATVPPVAMSDAGTVAVNEVELTNVVVSGVPPHNTTVPLTKLTPVAVMVKPASPAVAELGEIEVTPGEGLFTVNVAAVEVPPPGAGLNTVMEIVAVAVRSLAGTAALSEVALTKLVVSEVPFQFTNEPLTKFVPVTLS